MSVLDLISSMSFKELWSHTIGYTATCIVCKCELPLVPRDEVKDYYECPKGCGFTMPLRSVYDSDEMNELSEKEKRRRAYEVGDRLTP